MCAAAWSIVFFYVSKTGGSSWAWCYACRIAGTLPLVIIDESQNKILLPGRANCLVIYFVCPLLNILHRKDTLKCEQEPWDSLNARLAGDVQNRHACRLTRLTQPRWELLGMDEVLSCNLSSLLLRIYQHQQNPVSFLPRLRILAQNRTIWLFQSPGTKQAKGFVIFHASEAQTGDLSVNTSLQDECILGKNILFLHGGW